MTINDRWNHVRLERSRDESINEECGRSPGARDVLFNTLGLILEGMPAKGRNYGLQRWNRGLCYKPANIRQARRDAFTVTS